MVNRFVLIQRCNCRQIKYICSSFNKVVCAVLLIISFQISAAGSTYQFSMPKQRADISLIEYARVTGQDVLFPYDLVRQYQTNELVGEYTASEAIDLLLEDTWLKAVRSRTGNLLVRLDTIEEILVTAQKKEEAIGDVPVALTVLDFDTLANNFSYGMENIQNMVPSLTLRKGVTTRNSAAFLRGIGTTTFSIAAEPSVSTVVNGVVLARSGQAFGDIYDIERIEALRGPQGTLFGKNSSAGVINIITKGPNKDKWERTVDVSLFEDQEARVKAAISGPVNDSISMRITTFAGDFEGAETNLFDGQKVNGYQRKGLWAMLDIEPNDVMSIRMAAEYYRAEDNCCAAVVVPENEAGRPDIERYISNRVTDRDLVGETIDNSDALSLTLDWQLTEHSLTSITAYRSWENTEIDDADYSSAVNDIWVPDVNDGIGTFQRHAHGVQQTRQLSQELRLASVSEDKLQYQLGMFYWDVDTDRVFTRSSFLLCDPDVQGDVCDINGLGDIESFAPEATAWMDVGFNSFALFGHTTYDINERMRLINGLRWTRDEVSYRHRRINLSGVGAPGIRSEDHYSSDSQSSSEWSGRFGLQYDINDQWMTYATYAKGYKGPAYNVTFSMNPQRELPINPETADSYELGLRGSVFDGQTFISLTAYHVEYSDFQASNFILVNGVTSSNLTNAGNVVTQGVEFDVISRITKNLKLVGGGAFGSAKFSKFDCIREAAECVSRKGERVSFAPGSKLSVALEYFKELNNSLFNLHMNTHIAYQSGQFTNLGELNSNYLASRAIWNASIGLSNKNDSSRLSIVMKNLNDDAYATEARSDAGALVAIVPREAQRYFGINYRLMF